MYLYYWFNLFKRRAAAMLGTEYMKYSERLDTIRCQISANTSEAEVLLHHLLVFVKLLQILTC